MDRQNWDRRAGFVLPFYYGSRVMESETISCNNMHYGDGQRQREREHEEHEVISTTCMLDHGTA